MNKIAILYTTFLRDKLMTKTVNSILNNWKDNYYLLVADQGKHTKEKDIWFNEHKKFDNKQKQYIKMDFDVGAYTARNSLIKRAHEMGIPYCLVTADSIEFTSKYDCKPIIGFLEEKQTRGIVALDLEDRVPWEADIGLVGGRFLLDAPKRNKIERGGIHYQPVDICRNFFLAKTECLINNLWDENFKIGYHEGYFYTLKSTKWEVFSTDYIKGKYIESKPPNYNVYRRRLYKSERAKLKRKFDLKGWVKCTPEMRQTFMKFKRGNR